MEHEEATGQGAADVTARGDGQSGIVDDGGVGDTVADGEREADDSWWVSMTFSQDIIGSDRRALAHRSRHLLQSPTWRRGSAPGARPPASARAIR